METRLKNTGRMRARRLYKKIGNCCLCGKKATDRHHVNGDTFDNSVENIMFLCRRCHMDLDGRLKKITENMPRKITEPKPCLNCNKLSKPLRKGLCHACNEYFRRNNKPRPDFYKKSRVINEDMAKLIKKLRGDGIAYRKISKIVGVGATTIFNMFSDSPECHKKEHE